MFNCGSYVTCIFPSVILEEKLLEYKNLSKERGEHQPQTAGHAATYYCVKSQATLHSILSMSARMHNTGLSANRWSYQLPCLNLLRVLVAATEAFYLDCWKQAMINKQNPPKKTQNPDWFVLNNITHIFC